MQLEQVIETKVGSLSTTFKSGEKLVIFLSGQGYFSTFEQF